MRVSSNLTRPTNCSDKSTSCKGPQPLLMHGDRQAVENWSPFTEAWKMNIVNNLFGQVVWIGLAHGLQNRCFYASSSLVLPSKIHCCRIEILQSWPRICHTMLYSNVTWIKNVKWIQQGLPWVTRTQNKSLWQMGRDPYIGPLADVVIAQVWKTWGPRS